ALGDMAKVSILTEHPLLKEIQAKGLEGALGTAGGTLSNHKTHFVGIGFASGRYEVEARQLDGWTGLASPVLRRDETTDREFVARTAALLIARDFGVAGTLPPQQGSGEVRVTLKAGKLGPIDRWVQKGDVFAIVQVSEGSEGMRAERVPFALLQA